jgi:adenylate kinase
MAKKSKSRVTRVAKKSKKVSSRKSSARRASGKLVLILGPSGVGKTAVVNGALSTLGDKCQVVNFGHITQEVVGADRDKFRREATVEDFRDMQRKVAKRISKMASGTDKILLVTSHSVMFRESGFVPGFPKWVLDEMDVKLIVLISGLAEDISARRAADNAAGKTEGRTRDEVPIETIMAEQDVGRGVAYSYAMYSGAVVKEIINRQGKLEESAAELKKCLENV